VLVTAPTYQAGRNSEYSCPVKLSADVDCGRSRLGLLALPEQTWLTVNEAALPAAIDETVAQQDFAEAMGR